MDWRLPLVWICENNLYQQYLPVSIVYPKENIADLAMAYSGLWWGERDVIAIYEVIQTAVESDVMQ